MLRPGLAADRRAEVARAPMLQAARAVAAATVEQASSAAVVADQVEAAVGEGIATNPVLAQKLEALDGRLRQLEDTTEPPT